MKKVFFLLWALLLCSAVSINAQVRIGGGSMPHGAAVLDLNANNDSVPADNKGALSLPRVKLADNTATLNGTQPVNGMMVYNMGGTLSEGIYYWDGAKWVKMLNDTIDQLIRWTPVRKASFKVDPPGIANSWTYSIGTIDKISTFGTDTCAIVPNKYAILRHQNREDAWTVLPLNLVNGVKDYQPGGFVNQIGYTLGMDTLWPLGSDGIVHEYVSIPGLQWNPSTSYISSYRLYVPMMCW